jgi:hypothetical protein
MKTILAAGLLAAAVTGASARDESGCTPQIEDALRDVNPKKPLVGEVAAAHCKPWAAGRFVAAVMAFEQGESPDRRWTAVLALLDEPTLKVRHSRRFEIEEDAVTRVGPGSLRLDTANYALAPGVRALGLRYDDFGPGASLAESSLSDELTLFVAEGRSLRPVLRMPMSGQHAVKGSCLRNCPNPLWDAVTLTIAVGPPGPTGWNDLLVTATIVRDTDNEAGKPTRERLVYRYDGTTYKPQSAKPWWAY